MDVGERPGTGVRGERGALWLRRAAIGTAAVVSVGAVLAAGNVLAKMQRRKAALKKVFEDRLMIWPSFEDGRHPLQNLLDDASHLRSLELAMLDNTGGDRRVVDEAMLVLVDAFPECRKFLIQYRERLPPAPFLWPLQSLWRLEALELESCGATDAHCGEIARFSSLKTLTLAENPRIGDEGVRALRSLERLTELDLSWTSVGDDALSQGPLAPNLEVLDLRCTKVTAAGVEKLATWPALRRVSVSDPPITEKTADWTRLQRAGKQVYHQRGCSPRRDPIVP